MQKLKTDLASCDTVKITNSTGGEIAAESMHQEGKLIGVVIQKTANLAEGVLVYRAPSRGVAVPCPADATGVFAVGDAAFYDAGNKQVVNNAGKTGCIYCGNALEAAAEADIEVVIDLDGAGAKGVAED